MGQGQSNDNYNYNLNQALNDPQNRADSYTVLEIMARNKEFKELQELKKNLKNDKIARDRLHMLANNDVFKQCKTLSAGDCHNTYGCLPYMNDKNQAKCRNISKENFEKYQRLLQCMEHDGDENACKKKSRKCRYSRKHKKCVRKSRKRRSRRRKSPKRSKRRRPRRCSGKRKSPCKRSKRCTYRRSRKTGRKRCVKKY